jgi:PKD repeat protein
MMPGTGGLPDPAQIRSLVGVDATGGAAANPVDLEIGPGGDVFYVDMEGGKLHRITYTAANQPPTARISISPTTGNAPLTVSFSGTGSTDPEGGALTYSWDLDGNGTFGDATGPTASYTYTAGGTYRPALRVTDPQGATGTASGTVTVGNTAPTAVIDAPTSAVTWQVGDPINFSGHGTDPQQGTLPASAMSWEVIMHHCVTPVDCHTHVMQTIPGVASGTFAAPDHAYPCWIELKLTATDSGGLTSTASVRLDPRTVDLTFRTNPGGLKLANLTVNDGPQTTPFVTRVVINSANTVSAPPSQTVNRATYLFRSWSDGGASTHVIKAPSVPTTYTATYRK